MLLLLTQNSLQERTLRIMLKLGGHVAHVVNDEHEAINMIQNVPRKIRGVVLGTAGCQQTLAQRIQALRHHHINAPIFLVGRPGVEECVLNGINDSEHSLNMSLCNHEELLQALSTPRH